MISDTLSESKNWRISVTFYISTRLSSAIIQNFFLWILFLSIQIEAYKDDLFFAHHTCTFWTLARLPGTVTTPGWKPWLKTNASGREALQRAKASWRLTTKKKRPIHKTTSHRVNRYIVSTSDFTTDKWNPGYTSFPVIQEEWNSETRMCSSKKFLIMLCCCRRFFPFKRVSLDSEIIYCSNNFLYEEYCLLGYDAVWQGRNLPSFRRNVLPPSSGSKSRTSKQQARRTMSGTIV
jgi:hypothetical protein